MTKNTLTHVTMELN